MRRQDKQEGSGPRRWAFALGLVLLGAFAIRISGISFGLPGVLMPRPDEEFIYRTVLNFYTGDLNPRFQLYGHFFLYVYFVASLPPVLIDYLLSSNTSFTEYIVDLRCQRSLFVLIGRTLCSLIGTATVYLTYRYALTAFSCRRKAWTSALLLAVTFLHVRDAHYASVDTALTFLILATLYAALSIKRLHDKPFYLCAALCGVSLATKVSAVALVPAVMLGIAWRFMCGREPQSRVGRVLAGLMLFCVVMASSYAAVNAYYFLDPAQTAEDLLMDVFMKRLGPQTGSLFPAVWPMARVFAPLSFGWPTVIGAGLGLIAWLRKDRSIVGSVWFLFSAFYVVEIAMSQRFFARYLLPLAPILCMLAALFITDLAARVAGGRSGTATAIWLALTAVAAAPNLTKSILYDVRLLATDTRALAGVWIDEHAPANAPIAWIGSYYTAPRFWLPEQRYGKMISQCRTMGFDATWLQEVSTWVAQNAESRYDLFCLSFSLSGDTTATPLEMWMSVRPDPSVRALPLHRRPYNPLPWMNPNSPRSRDELEHVALEGAVSQFGDLERKPEYVVLTSGRSPKMPEAGDRLKGYRLRKALRPCSSPGRFLWDTPDAWFLPMDAAGLLAYDRPGPYLWIFELRPDDSSE